MANYASPSMENILKASHITINLTEVISEFAIHRPRNPSSLGVVVAHLLLYPVVQIDIRLLFWKVSELHNAWSRMNIYIYIYASFFSLVSIWLSYVSCNICTFCTDEFWLIHPSLDAPANSIWINKFKTGPKRHWQHSQYYWFIICHRNIVNSIAWLYRDGLAIR